MQSAIGKKTGQASPKTRSHLLTICKEKLIDLAKKKLWQPSFTTCQHNPFSASEWKGGNADGYDAKGFGVCFENVSKLEFLLKDNVIERPKMDSLSPQIPKSSPTT